MGGLAKLSVVAASIVNDVDPAKDDKTAGSLGEAADEYLGVDISQATPMLLEYGTRVVGALVLLFIAWIVARLVGRIVGNSLQRTKFDATLTKFFARLIRWLILLLALLMCLSIFGVETTSFAAVIGAATLAIGFALKDTMANFASGVMLLVFRPYKVGDVVNVAGNLGIVDEIGLFTTELDTFDNRRIIVPNGTVFGAVIENITHHPRRRADVNVGVTYSADIDRTRAVLEEAIRSVEGVLDDPEPAVILLDLGPSSVDWSARVWARAEDFGAVKQATIRAVKTALDNARIEIPFPQMDVHVTQSSDS